MRFNFDAQWLAAVTYKELIMLRVCVSNQIYRLKTMYTECGKDEDYTTLKHPDLVKLEEDLIKMEEIARTAPIEVIP